MLVLWKKGSIAILKGGVIWCHWIWGIPSLPIVQILHPWFFLHFRFFNKKYPQHLVNEKMYLRMPTVSEKIIFYMGQLFPPTNNTRCITLLTIAVSSPPDVSSLPSGMWHRRSEEALYLAAHTPAGSHYSVNASANRALYSTLPASDGWSPCLIRRLDALKMTGKGT